MLARYEIRWMLGARVPELMVEVDWKRQTQPIVSCQGKATLWFDDDEFRKAAQNLLPRILATARQFNPELKEITLR